MRAISRSNAIYRIIEESDGFYNLKCADVKHRSRMNIPFRIGSVSGDPDLEDEFCSLSEQQGLLQLFCHPLFPGCRITLYNGISDHAVEALQEFMIKFAREKR